MSRTSVAFPPTFVGAVHKETITIRNDGGLTLTGSVGSLSAPFSVSPSGSFSLEKKKSLRLVITFSPASTTPATGQLTITSNDPTHPSVTVNLTGTGKEKPTKKK